MRPALLGGGLKRDAPGSGSFPVGWHHYSDIPTTGGAVATLPFRCSRAPEGKVSRRDGGAPAPLQRDGQLSTRAMGRNLRIHPSAVPEIMRRVQQVPSPAAPREWGRRAARAAGVPRPPRPAAPDWPTIHADLRRHTGIVAAGLTFPSGAADISPKRPVRFPHRTANGVPGRPRPRRRGLMRAMGKSESMEIRDRYPQGVRISALIRETGPHRQTIRAIVRTTAPRSAEPPAPARRPPLLALYAEDIRQRTQESCRNTAVLSDELCARGYPGRRTTRKDFVAPRCPRATPVPAVRYETRPRRQAHGGGTPLGETEAPEATLQKLWRLAYPRSDSRCLYLACVRHTTPDTLLAASSRPAPPLAGCRRNCCPNTGAPWGCTIRGAARLPGTRGIGTSPGFTGLSPKRPKRTAPKPKAKSSARFAMCGATSGRGCGPWKIWRTGIARPAPGWRPSPMLAGTRPRGPPPRRAGRRTWPHVEQRSLAPCAAGVE